MIQNLGFLKSIQEIGFLLAGHHAELLGFGHVHAVLLKGVQKGQGKFQVGVVTLHDHGSVGQDGTEMSLAWARHTKNQYQT